MVLHVCRQVLDDSHDAQDAFQATFLVFLRRAGSIRKRDSLASWLFGVAMRVARRARYAAVVRRFHEQRAGELAAAPPRRPTDTPSAWRHCTRRLRGFRSDTESRLCFAISKGYRPRPRPSGSAVLRGRSSRVWLAAASGCADG